MKVNSVNDFVVIRNVGVVVNLVGWRIKIEENEKKERNSVFLRPCVDRMPILLNRKV